MWRGAMGSVVGERRTKAGIRRRKVCSAAQLIFLYRLLGSCWFLLLPKICVSLFLHLSLCATKKNPELRFGSGCGCVGLSQCNAMISSNCLYSLSGRSSKCEQCTPLLVVSWSWFLCPASAATPTSQHPAAHHTVCATSQRFLHMLLI